MLQVTRQLIERGGATGLNMDEIATAAGVTRRTLYDHFGSRAGLLVALAEQADRDIDLEQRLAPVFSAPSAIVALERLVEVVADVTPGMLDLATAIERARVEDPDADAAWQDRMASRLQACRAMIERLRAEGDLRPELTVEEGADLLFAAISWQAWDLLVSERGWTPEQWARRTADLLRRTLTEG